MKKAKEPALFGDTVGDPITIVITSPHEIWESLSYAIKYNRFSLFLTRSVRYIINRARFGHLLKIYEDLPELKDIFDRNHDNAKLFFEESVQWCESECSLEYIDKGYISFYHKHPSASAKKLYTLLLYLILRDLPLFV